MTLGQVIALIKALGGSGGGSGLPTPTASDIGKVAAVVGETSKGAVIVPEQRVQAEYDDKAFDDADASLFTNGATVIVTITQGVSPTESVTVERTATVDSHGGIEVLAADGSTTVYILNYNGTMKYAASIAQGSGIFLKIAVNLAQIDASWGMATGGGVLVVGETISGEDDNVHTLDHTWQEIFDADWFIVVDRASDRVSYAIPVSVIVIPSFLPGGTTKYNVVVGTVGSEETITYEASSRDGYPTYTAE